MSRVLALSPEPAPVAWNPLPTAPRTDAERFRLSLEAQLATGNFASEERNLRLMFDEAAEALREAGADVANPYEAGEFQGSFLHDIGSLAQRVILPGASSLRATVGVEERRRREIAWDQAVTRLREERPEEADRYLTTAEVREMAARRARNAAEAARLPEDLGGGFGGFLGATAGVFADPAQVLTLPLGAGRMAGPILSQILRAAAIEAGVAGATQAVVELRAAPYRQSLGLDDDGLAQVAMAAAGGAVIGGGLRGLIAGVERLAGRGGPDAEAALAAARAEAQAAAMRPGAAEQQAAHDAAVRDAVGALLEGRPVTASVPAPSGRLLAQWIEQPEPGREAEAIGGFVERAITRADGRVRGLVVEWLGDADVHMLEGFGIPVGPDTPRILVSDRVRHAWVHHGPDAARPDGAPPIAPSDIVGYRGFIANAIDAQRSVTDAGQPAITYLARDEQGGLVVVEEYRARSGVLAFSNLYRLPPGHGAQRVDQVPGMQERLRRAREAPSVPNANPRAGSPELTSETPEGLPGGMPDPRGRFNVYTPAGRAVMVEPRVISLSRLVPSHDAEGRLNPAYPHAEGVQPRDRSAAPSAEQVRQIVARFAPERLLPNREAGAGAPIVNPHDLVVESGNGRVMALMRVFRDPELAHLRDAYLDALRRAGFDIEGIEDPVVVSARITPLSPAERIAFVREANGRLAAAETVAEAARRDAGIAAEALPLWRGGAVDAAANREFLRAFVARLPPEDLPDLIRKDGAPLPALVARVERALLQAAYGDALGPVLDRLLAGQTEGFRALAGALRNVAGDWASLRAEIAAGRVAPDQEATPALAEAVAAIIEAQDRRLRVADLVGQMDFERPPMTPAGLAMLRAMHAGQDLTRRVSPEPKLTAMLQGFLDRARAVPPGADMFGTPPATAAETLAAAGRAVQGASPAPQPRVPADPQAARLAEAGAEARRLAALPETARAELLEARRLAAMDGNLRVPDASGERPAIELLAEAEAQAAEAAEAAACLIGGAA